MACFTDPSAVLPQSMLPRELSPVDELGPTLRELSPVDELGPPPACKLPSLQASLEQAKQVASRYDPPVAHFGLDVFLLL